MKGKKARRARRIINFLTNKAAIPVAICGLACIPMKADAEIIFSVFPHYVQPLPVGDTHNIQSGIGAGLRLTYRPFENINLFLQGDYMSLSLPNVDSITLLSGSVGAGYHIPLGERFSLNMNMSLGGYKAKYKDSMTSLEGQFAISLEYKINPIVSGELESSIGHYNAGETPLMTGAQVSPGVSLNVTQLLGMDPKVQIEQKRLDPIFPVLYSWYESNPFGQVAIKNREDSGITNVSVKFFQPQYMSQPNECAKIDRIEKGESMNVDLTAFFNERMLDLLDMTDTQATITVDYEVLGIKKKQTLVMRLPVCGRNSMSWDDDRRAAVFVSSKDPAAMWYSKLVSSVVRDGMRNGVPENIQFAMGIFDTLDEFGINYVIDPTSSYADNVGTTSIDFLQFPYQTLMYRGGDCDDLSILTCSLLEAVGIHSAFITIPGHIFIAFDSGLAYEEAKIIFSEKDYFINHDGEAWIPLEITLTDEGFTKAWRSGAMEWQTAEAQGTAAIYPMHDSWKLYKPVSVPGASIKFTMVEEEKISRIYEHSIDEWIAREINDKVDEYLAKIKESGRAEDMNELGILFGRYGIFEKAEEQLKVARRKKFLPAIINTANVYFSMKEFKLARQWYEYYLDEDPGNALALLGIAKCSYELEEYNRCDEAFSEVIATSPALATNNTYLGAFENKSGRSFNLSERISNTIWIRSEDQLSLYKKDPESGDENSDEYVQHIIEMAMNTSRQEKEEKENSKDDGKPGLEGDPNKGKKGKDEKRGAERIAAAEKIESNAGEGSDDGEIIDISSLSFNEPKDISLSEKSQLIAEIDTDIEGLDTTFEVDRIVGLKNQIEIPHAKIEEYEPNEPKKPAVTKVDSAAELAKNEEPTDEQIKEEVSQVEEVSQILEQNKDLEAIAFQKEQEAAQEKKRTPNEQPKSVQIALAEEKAETPKTVEDLVVTEELKQIAEDLNTILTPDPDTRIAKAKTENAEIAMAEESAENPVPQAESENAQIAMAEESAEMPVPQAESESAEIAMAEESAENPVPQAESENAEIAMAEESAENPVPQAESENAQIAMAKESAEMPVPQAESESAEIAMAEESAENPVPQAESESTEIAMAEESAEMQTPATDEPKDMSEVFDKIWDATDDTNKVAIAEEPNDDAKDMSDVLDEFWDDEDMDEGEFMDTEELFEALEVEITKDTLAKAKEEEMAERERLAKESGVNGLPPEDAENPYVNVEFRPVPRYTPTPASEWATPESYVQDKIPGMKPYEQELGVTDEKAYITEGNREFLRTPVNDVEQENEKKEEKQKEQEDEKISLLESIGLKEVLEREKAEAEAAARAEENADNAEAAIPAKSALPEVPESAKKDTEETATAENGGELEETDSEENDSEEIDAEENDTDEIDAETNENESDETGGEVEETESSEIDFSTKAKADGKNEESPKSPKSPIGKSKSKKTKAREAENERKIEKNRYNYIKKDSSVAAEKENASGQVGDETKEINRHWLLWLFLGCGTVGFFILFLIFWKRDKKEEEENSGIQEGLFEG